MEKSKQKYLNIPNFLFSLVIIIFCLSSSNFISIDLTIVKYIFLLLGISYNYIIYTKKNNIKCKKYILLIGKTLSLFLLISIIYSIKESQFSFRTISEILFIILPILYAYLYINIVEYKKIHKIMKKCFFIVFAFYILSLGLNIQNIFSALLNSSFFNSTSLLESSVYSGFSLSFMFYFSYYDENKIYKYLSFLFVIMTFKRFAILIAIILLIISFTKYKHMQFKNNICIYMATFIIATSSLLLYWVLIPKNAICFEQKFNTNLSEITTTRNERFFDLYNSSYKSYGFGSSVDYMEKHNFYGTLEMDLVKIIVEIGFIPLIIFIYCFLKLSNNNIYLFIFMFFKIFALVITSSLTNSFSWLLVYITIFLINTDRQRWCLSYEN